MSKTQYSVVICDIKTLYIDISKVFYDVPTTGCSSLKEQKPATPGKLLLVVILLKE